VADGWGGVRKGAGRKPKAITEIRAIAREDFGPQGQVALGRIAAIAADPRTPVQLAFAANVWVAEFCYGKAAQTNNNVNSGEMVVHVIYDDEENDNGREASAPATPAPGATAGEVIGAPV